MAEGEQIANTPVGAIETSIAGPLILWIAFLICGVVIALLLTPLVSSNATAKSLLTSLANWILYLPGSLILPLIVSIWMGESVGKSRGSATKSAKIGEVNALYTALIYVIVIVIIYLLFYYIDNSALANVTTLFFVEYVIVIPVVIVMILTPIVSALSAFRHAAA